MPNTDVKDLRNVALLSHSGAGKTSLAETMLFNVKATTRMGRIEDGNTLSDYEPEEAKRRSSIQTTLVACTTGDSKVNFLDTPGLTFSNRPGCLVCRRNSSGSEFFKHGRQGNGAAARKHLSNPLLLSITPRHWSPARADSRFR